MTRSRVMVTGAAGQLGRALVHEFADAEVITRTRIELDVSDEAAVTAAVTELAPDVILNAAAYNDVDRAEVEAVAALEANAFAVQGLAAAAARRGAVLVHYGTDFVFDGNATEPYGETDRPNPRSTYAASKLLGEWFAEMSPRHYVLRVESLFGGRIVPLHPALPGPPRTGSVDRIIDALIEGRDAPVFVDRVVSPSYVIDVARATRHLIETGSPFGLYHCVNAGHTTWYELGQAVARRLPAPGRVLPVSVETVELPAARPRFCALSSRKLAAVGAVMRPWQDALTDYLERRLAAAGAGERPASRREAPE